MLSNFVQDPGGSALPLVSSQSLQPDCWLPTSKCCDTFDHIVDVRPIKIITSHLPILKYSIMSTSPRAPPPSKLNRARQMPANRLQLKMKLVAWVVPLLRPLGTSPPDHLVTNRKEKKPGDVGLHKERFWSQVAREEFQGCTRHRLWLARLP